MSAECGQPWCCGKTEKKTKRKNEPVVHGNKIHVCRRVHAHTQMRSSHRAEIVQAAKLRSKRSPLCGRREKKYAREQKTREVTVHTRRNRRARRRERRKNYLHQDSAQFSSYHATNDKSMC